MVIQYPQWAFFIYLNQKNILSSSSSSSTLLTSFTAMMIKNV